ncbi:MAG: aminotransferase class V-fold PLP-dependent enzyme [Deltaproteobacteria bacterium]|jgi:cysteine desulfurase family protein|nr:aminotransferase class V-fold PLP-dependent enzyme [Deltaproteobacteria bacterium]
MIYFDNGATSFPKPPQVGTAIMAALAAPASPGRSGHAPAMAAGRTIHRARKALAKLFGLKENGRICFGPNVTWGLNAALTGLGLERGDHVLSGSLEHNSTARPLAKLKAEKGLDWEIVPPVDGLMTAEGFKKLLRPETKLVVLNHASNVSGALAPAREIKKAIGNVPLLLDSAQTAGSVPLEDAGSWVDLLAFTGHKGLLGPTGTGGLWVGPNVTLRPTFVGGSGSRSESLEHPDFLPDALEAGTANTHGLAGLAAGVEYALQTGVENIRGHELLITHLFIKEITQIDELSMQGPGLDQTNRVATVSLNLKGWSSSDLAGALEREHGILTRAGLHCAPLTHRALGTFPGGSVRFSFGPFNTPEEIQTGAKALKALARQKGR